MVRVEQVQEHSFWSCTLTIFVVVVDHDASDAATVTKTMAFKPVTTVTTA